MYHLLPIKICIFVLFVLMALNRCRFEKRFPSKKDLFDIILAGVEIYLLDNLTGMLIFMLRLR